MRIQDIVFIIPKRSIEHKIAPHIGIGYLTSFLMKFSYNVSIIDLQFESLSHLKTTLKLYQNVVVGLSFYSEDYNRIKFLLKFIKKINKNYITIVGGPHPTAQPIQILKELEDLDFVITGEGEYTFKELLNEINSTKNYSKIPGLTYRDGIEIIKNQTRELIEDLDSIPFPAWEKYNLKRYQTFFNDSSKNFEDFPLITQRGCPFNCIFCFKINGNKVRYRSIENVILEIEFLIKNYNVKHIAILDSTFTVNKRRTIELCKALIRSEINKKIQWSCMTRVDCIDEQLLKYMKLAGCHLIFYGVESGNDEILNKISKGINLNSAYNAIRLTKKYNITTHVSMIYGHPYESLNSMKESLNFVLETRPHAAHFQILVPYPGTHLYDIALKKKGGLELISLDWADCNVVNGHALELKQLPNKLIVLFHLYSYIRYYLHPFSFKHMIFLINWKTIPIVLLNKIYNIIKKD
jgi:anaerobic magnesium-protoporphyrin IX monomethyl ester cyclase